MRRPLARVRLAARRCLQPAFALVFAPALALAAAGCLPHGELFAPPARTFVGLYPVAGFVGDVNGDGKVDLVVGRNEANGTLGVQLGNGDGTFQWPLPILASNPPRASYTADVNGDGKVDLVFSSFVDGGYVSVCLGLGDGHFEAPRNFASGRSPASMRVADVTGDGKPDIVLVNTRPAETAAVAYLSGNLTVLPGNGDGTFQAARTQVVGVDPTSVALGDWNGDGHIDAAVGDDLGRRLVILLNQGDGSFVEHAAYDMPFGARTVLVADFNHDGRPDLVVRHTGASVLLGAGDGSFLKTSTVVTDVTESIAVADFDGDGNPDIASARRVLFGDGTGEFPRAIQYDALNRDAFVAGGDVNGDGVVDLVVIDGFHNSVKVYLNRTTPPAPRRTASLR